MDDLGHVRREVGELDTTEDDADRDDPPSRPVPARGGQDQEQRRGQQQRAGDGQPVGSRQLAGRAEREHQREDAAEEQPVHRRHVDLPALARRRVPHGEVRQEAEAYRLARHRERAGDDGLRRDHRGQRGQHDHRDTRPTRREQVERIADRRRLVQHERTLAEVVDDQRGEDEGEPADPDRPASEVAHVRIQRLGAGDGQHDRAHRDESGVGMIGEEGADVGGRQAAQHLGVLRDARQPGQYEHDEPDDHDRPEQPADLVRAPPLRREEHGKDDRTDRQHDIVRRRRGHLDALDRGQYRDGRRDQAVAVEQRGADDAEHHRDGDAPGVRAQLAGGSARPAP